MEVGRHLANIISHEVAESDGGAVLVWCNIQFANGEVERGVICLVKKDGSVMDKNVEQARKMFGWNDDSIENFAALTYEPIPVDVYVELEEYKGRPHPRITRFWPARKQADPEAAKKIAAKFASAFKKSATTLSVKKLSDVPVASPAEPVAAPVAEQEPVATTPAPAPVVETPKRSPRKVAVKPSEPVKEHASIVTYKKFKSEFADLEEDNVTLLWHDLLEQQLGAMFDTDKATDDDWRKVYLAIPEFKKNNVETKPVADNIPF